MNLCNISCKKIEKQRSVGENADIYFVYMLIFCENMV